MNAPTNLVATPVSEAQINLTWKDNSTREAGFQVFRSLDNTSFTKIATVGRNVISCSAIGLTAATKYYFKVRSYRTGASSPYSNTVSATTLGSVPPPPPPPSGDGIAARYPGDVNIGSDPDVILADNFESYSSASGLLNNWTSVPGVNSGNVKITTTDYFTGSKCLEFDMPAATGERGYSVNKRFTGVDTLFCRVYMKWDAGYSFSTSNHNGICMNGGNNPHTGQAPNGSDFFVVMLQNNNVKGEPPPGWLHAYVYWPKQQAQWGDHWYPTGMGFPVASSPDFKVMPNFLPLRDRWYCYEQMVKLNTPGQNNGEVKIWVDGQVAGDWPNLVLRTVDSLKIDLTYFGLHAIHSERLNKKWYDNAVIAKSYIGPVAQ